MKNKNIIVITLLVIVFGLLSFNYFSPSKKIANDETKETSTTVNEFDFTDELEVSALGLYWDMIGQTENRLNLDVQISGSENINIKDLNLYKIKILSKNKNQEVDLESKIIDHKEDNALSFSLEIPNWEFSREIDIEIELDYRNRERKTIKKTDIVVAATN